MHNVVNIIGNIKISFPFDNMYYLLILFTFHILAF